MQVWVLHIQDGAEEELGFKGVLNTSWQQLGCVKFREVIYVNPMSTKTDT